MGRYSLIDRVGSGLSYRYLMFMEYVNEGNYRGADVSCISRGVNDHRSGAVMTSQERQEVVICSLVFGLLFILFYVLQKVFGSVSPADLLSMTR